MSRRNIEKTSIRFLLVFGAVTFIYFLFAGPSDVMWYQWRNVFIVRHLGQQGYFAYDLIRTLSLKIYQETGGMTSLLDEASLAKVKDFQKRNLTPPNLKYEYDFNGNRPNIIFLQLESLDHRLFESGEAGCKHIPFMCGLKRDGIWFENAYDQTASGTTSDAEMLALTSTVPIQNQVISVFHDMSKLNSLPKLLTKTGYYSIYAQGNTSHSYQRGRIMKELGFTQVLSMEDLDASDLLGKGISDESFFKQIADKIRNLPQPFFGFFISLTSHHPYKDVNKRLDKLDMGLELNYLSSVNYLDSSIEKFFSALDKEGQLENTLFIIYGDHQSSVPSLLGQSALADKKIPIFFYMKNKKQAEVVSSYSAIQDLMPTVLFELGLTPSRCLAGSPWASNSRVVLPKGRLLGEDIDEEFPSFEFSLTQLYGDSSQCF